MSLADSVYEMSARFPRDERFGLTQQLRRAALSVAANIAEGAGRGADPDFRRFLHIALGSLEESQTFLEFACRRRWISDSDVSGLRDKVGELRAKLLTFIRKLERDIRSR